MKAYKRGKKGTPILASAESPAATAKSGYTSYGKYIVIDHGNGFQTIYGHNSELLVNVGDTVNQGQQIAKMGNTGNTSSI